jgi:hypothetical protein
MTEATPAHDPAQDECKKVEQIVANKEYVNDPELLPWYTKELEEPKPVTRELFEQYSKVPPGDVVAHIKYVRDEAFKIVCIPPTIDFPILILTLSPVPLSMPRQLGLSQLHNRRRTGLPGSP